MSNSPLAHQDVRNELYELMRDESPFTEKAQSALELGREYLDVDNGHLTRIDAKTDYWETIVSTDPPDGQFPAGLELDLGTTYCRRTVESNSQIALYDAPTQGWADDPAFETHGLHCYLGTTLIVDDEPYGTVCFVSETPHEAPFSQSEQLFAELITRLLERELERSQHETQLIRQTNLASVLNRVLRHNLRNDMAVIRGFTQLMAERLDDDQHSSVALKKIDKFIELGEKARELDEIISAEFEREPTSIVSLIEVIAESVSEAYPSASITIEADEEITVAVLPSFERAVEELIENAAKHGGDEPTITVTVEAVPNAVEINIADDGPGLASHEADVLKTGAETPLTHGTGLGLWLAYWIITNHEGSIEALDSSTGTTLSVRIPRTPISDAEAEMCKLVRSRDQFQAAFEEAADGMTIVDNEARILTLNTEAARIFGRDKQQLLGRSIQEFLPEDFDFDAEWEEFQSSAVKRDEVEILRPDGGTIAVENCAKADFIPGQHLIISRDISERKAHERKLERKIERLDAFASTISHDLRNPLSVAQGQLELAAAETDSEHFEPIKRAHTRMESMIDDLLTLARDGSSAIDPEPVALAGMIEECWANTETGDATLVIEVEQTIRADSDRLKQILENLFRNAVEHGGEDMTVTVGEEVDGFYVEDDGVGIPRADHETVFEDGYSSEADGTGFGLSIVKQGTEAHGWRINVTDRLPSGVRFEITGVERVQSSSPELAIEDPEGEVVND